MIKFEDHEGSFKYGVKDGLGRNIKLKDSEMYGDEEEFRREVLGSSALDYQEFIGDFVNDRPVYHSGVLKNVKVPVDQMAQQSKQKTYLSLGSSSSKPNVMQQRDEKLSN
jgi:hypothetical protein